MARRLIHDNKHLRDNVTPPDMEIDRGDRKQNSSQMDIDPTVATNQTVINRMERVIKVTEMVTKVTAVVIEVMVRE